MGLATRKLFIVCALATRSASFQHYAPPLAPELNIEKQFMEYQKKETHSSAWALEYAIFSSLSVLPIFESQHPDDFVPREFIGAAFDALLEDTPEHRRRALVMSQKEVIGSPFHQYEFGVTPDPSMAGTMYGEQEIPVGEAHRRWYDDYNPTTQNVVYWAAQAARLTARAVMNPLSAIDAVEAALIAGERNGSRENSKIIKYGRDLLKRNG